VSHLHHKKNLVREPEKKGRQKRNQTDLFFDSIVGRHSTGNGEFNEYVIYNRKQCCPLYLVSYQKQMNSPSMSILQERPQPSASSGYEDAYQKARTTLPPFAWTNGTPNRTPNWPLFAKNVFDLMKDGVDLGLGLGSAASIFAPPRSLLPETPFLDDTDTDTAMKLSAILGLGIEGYMDDVTNVRLLRRFRYNLEDTIDYILQVTSEKGSADRAIDDAIASFAAAGASASASGPGSSSTATSTSVRDQVTEDNISSIISKTGAMGGFPHPQLQQAKSKSRDRDNNRPEQAFCLKKVKLEPNDRDQDGRNSPVSDFSSPSQSPKEEKNDDCPICCMDYPSGDNYWKILLCTHKLCIPCHERLESKGVTMSGVEHTFLKCPFCQSCSGQEIGSCPNGVMNVTHGYYDCAGYEGYGSLCINYDIQRTSTSKYSLNRTAYLPNSPKGNNVLTLLQTAFDRRLIFSIGTSMTTGRTDTLVWNIHHKTQLQGGAQAHGYPDPTYLDRVLDELKQYGLELKNDQVVPAIAINKT
jgi:deltex-like protein